MKAKLKNLLSRKFILALIAVIGGIGTCLKAVNDPVIQIAGVIIAGVGASVYIIVEGNCDTSSINATIVDTLKEIKEIQQNESDTE